MLRKKFFPSFFSPHCRPHRPHHELRTPDSILEMAGTTNKLRQLMKCYVPNEQVGKTFSGTYEILQDVERKKHRLPVDQIYGNIQSEYIQITKYLENPDSPFFHEVSIHKLALAHKMVDGIIEEGERYISADPYLPKFKL